MSRMTPMKRALLLVVSLTLTLLVAGAALAQTTPATPQKPAAGEKPKPAT
jgi:hypothetical protein